MRSYSGAVLYGYEIQELNSDFILYECSLAIYKELL